MSSTRKPLPVASRWSRWRLNRLLRFVGSREGAEHAREGTWAVIAGGGTAGHVTPALAIARALVARGHDPETIQFVGTTRGIEARLVPEAGFPLTLLPGRGIKRKLTLENLSAGAGLLVALAQALMLLARLRPRVVVSVGGFASAPCALAAAVLRVPLVLAEQNAAPGAAHRLVARFARAAAISFPNTPLPRATLTGNPVRSEILAVDRASHRAAARAALGLPPERRVVAVFGGSLGARRLNLAVLGALSIWADRADLAVRHLVGDRDWQLVVEAAPALSGEGVLWQPVRYEHRMDLLYAAADLAVCRAGASTVAELAVVGLPAVLVPLPHAPSDHQRANAEALAAAGAAVVVPDGELTPDRLVAEVDASVSDPLQLDLMAKSALAVSRPDAAQRVAALVEASARG